MPAFVPPATTLLEAAATELEREILPALAGAPRYRARIVLNVLRTVARELRLGPDADAAERERLCSLLGADGALDLPSMRASLAARIERGELALDDAALLAHLEASLREALAINHPGWDHDD
jgi:hypothetical protein